MWLNILLFIIIVVGLFFGWRRGFMAQIGSVLGIILGIICCNLFATKLAATFTETTDDAASIMLNNVMAYIIVFVIAYIGGRLIGSLFHKAIKALHLGILNKIFGAIYMPLEYILVLSIVLNAWVGAFPQTDLRSDISGTKAFVMNLAPEVFGSRTVSDVFNSVQDSLKKKSEESDDQPDEATPEPQPEKAKKSSKKQR